MQLVNWLQVSEKKDLSVASPGIGASNILKVQERIYPNTIYQCGTQISTVMCIITVYASTWYASSSCTDFPRTV